VGLGPENDCAGEDQQKLKTIERGCYVRTITVSVQQENKITGRESQGACRQDELIGTTPPIVKQLGLWGYKNEDVLPSRGGVTRSSQTPPLVEEEVPFENM
jgi:hypothetical protein